MNFLPVESVSLIPESLFSWFSTSFESGTSCCSGSLASAVVGLGSTSSSVVVASEVESSVFPFPVLEVSTSADLLPAVVSTSFEDAATSFVSSFVFSLSSASPLDGADFECSALETEVALLAEFFCFFGLGFSEDSSSASSSLSDP